MLVSQYTMMYFHEICPVTKDLSILSQASYHLHQNSWGLQNNVLWQNIWIYKLHYKFFVCLFCQKISKILLSLFGVTFIFSFLWWPCYIYFLFKIEWHSIKLFDGVITISVYIHMGMTSLCVFFNTFNPWSKCCHL